MHQENNFATKLIPSAKSSATNR